MNPHENSEPLEPSSDDSDFPAREPDADAPKSRAGTPVAVPLLSEPVVVLKDPPAIFGGASHTW
jgi:hypothetical protein